MKKSIVLSFVATTLLLCIVTLYANWKILNFRDAIVLASQVPNSTLALVFGGGMNADGSQSQMQEDRVRRGVQLYQTGKVERLLMTGDDGDLRGDEVDAMRELAVSLGVPSSSVLVDPHGYRTYESCYREKNVYHITSTIAISQTFHLPRIIYFCDSMGIHTVGVAADLRDYGFDLTKMRLREVLARVKGWWQMEITKPLPRSVER